MGALAREVKEETDLELEDKVLFVDSYYYGSSLGAALYRLRSYQHRHDRTGRTVQMAF